MAQEADNAAFIKSDEIRQKVLDQQANDFLSPQQNLPFEPWPSYAVIQGGALADIQRLVESGRDPASVLSAEERAEADRRRQEDEEREMRAEEERRRRVSIIDPGRRRETVERPDVFNPDD